MDGNTDIAVANNECNSVSVFYGNGDLTFEPHVMYGTGIGSAGTVAADFDKDGDIDLAVACFDNDGQPGNSVSVLINRTIESSVVSSNVRLHPDAIRNQSEVTITTHPLNPNIVFAGWNSGDLSGIPRIMGWSLTTDGGANWVGSDTLPTHPGAIRMADPALAVDLEGNLFFNGQVRGGTSAQRFVARSTNNGSEWTLATGLATTYTVDKQHFTADVNPASPFADWLYTAFTKDAAPREIVFSRSTDRGVSFSSAVTISDSINGLYGPWGVNLVVGANGELYAAWAAYDDGGTLVHPVRLGFSSSTDGGATWVNARSIRTINHAYYYMLNKGGNGIADWTYPSMSVDRGHGPRRGWVYLAFSELAPTPDIFLIRSTDKGISWSSPVKVNQDDTGRDHWNQWMRVDPSSGNIYIIYYDSRNFPSNDSAQVYISCSTNGGVTFKDSPVSSTPFLPTPIPGFFTGYMGDYSGVTALNGQVWPSWNDNRTGIHQAFTSHIVFPPVSVDEEHAEVPMSFALAQNYPNPFNPTTKIGFGISNFGFVSLRVYDLLGREVAVLVNEKKAPGAYTVQWNASGFASGVYFCRLETSTTSKPGGSFVETKKLLLIR